VNRTYTHFEVILRRNHINKVKYREENPNKNLCWFTPKRWGYCSLL